jgi:hypothetical protein
MKLFAFLFAFGAAQDFSKFEKLAGDLDNLLRSATEGIEQVLFILEDPSSPVNYSSKKVLSCPRNATLEILVMSRMESTVFTMVSTSSSKLPVNLCIRQLQSTSI